MRVTRLVISAAAAVGLTVAVAAPASADHLAEVASFTKPAACYLGELASGTGVSVDGRLLSSSTYRDGEPRRYECLFADFPKHVDADSNEYGIEFTLGPRGYRSDNIPCIAPSPTYGVSYGTAELRVASNGLGRLRCSLAN